MAGSRKQQKALADAQQALRDLKNQLHLVEVERVFPLRKQLAELTRDNERIGRELHRALSGETAYKRAYLSMIALELHRLDTGKKDPL